MLPSAERLIPFAYSVTECPAKPVAYVTAPGQMCLVRLNQPRDTSAQARAQRELLLRARRRRSWKRISPPTGP